ncbi:hypothetical protein C4S77_06170 [Apibacter adventoris]|uniref:Uncharacterized protein n=2 Tax=Apibacter adventoris TaxID=1679466 RepID=A0A2S8ACA6_9FLAO|nr:hypothetical protein C4S77_06170 [Apibacter adventoris]
MYFCEIIILFCAINFNYNTNIICFSKIEKIIIFMNKLLSFTLSFIICLSYFTSCKESKKISELTNNIIKKDSSSLETINGLTNERSTLIQIPIFKDKEVQQYVIDYDAYVKEYIKAIKSKDIPRLTSLGLKAKEWTKKEQFISKKLVTDSNELKKYNNYILGLTNDLEAAINEK